MAAAKKHDYKMHFEMEPNDKTITIEIEDKITNKKWRALYSEKDYNDVEAEFKKIQDCISNGESEIEHPANDGEDLILTASKGNNSYRFQLSETN
mmetsp:Transcript_73884/g.117769  ORF Transcript_73884/g.117769 Transcript_73884/m.117769 type:complete len:95 (+) Transcript_73884:137-421(+)|eukprot:CAMPEP_0197059342 /NCGR_PEP_ID=MMETSP1384-20130603/116685_1 /TAXON_ID=29189 /ORGANISM="Ammonia sp." /LENGTH=94 /DNA_ID=CAMNT_0042494387 /DNA_START=122 /DNA_END=406 /DNA_ORIENTATION=-